MNPRWGSKAVAVEPTPRPLVTHVGGPTTLIELAGWRLFTDPTFDPPGRRYFFGWGAFSRKVTGPAIAVGDLGPIDAVLLSYDQHGDGPSPRPRSLG